MTPTARNARIKLETGTGITLTDWALEETASPGATRMRLTGWTPANPDLLAAIGDGRTLRSADLPGRLARILITGAQISAERATESSGPAKVQITWPQADVTQWQSGRTPTRASRGDDMIIDMIHGRVLTACDTWDRGPVLAFCESVGWVAPSTPTCESVHTQAMLA